MKFSTTIIILQLFILSCTHHQPYNNIDNSTEYNEKEKLIASFNFNNNSPYDDSNNNIKINLSENTVINNEKLILNAAGNIIITNNIPMSPKTGIKLNLDIEFENINSDFIIDNYNKETNSGYLLRTINSNRLAFYIGLSNKIEYVETHINKYTKYNVTAIYANNILAIYLNELIKDWKHVNGPIIYNDINELYIGSSSKKNQFFKGKIDNLNFSLSKNISHSITTKSLPDILTNKYYEYKINAILLGINKFTK